MGLELIVGQLRREMGRWLTDSATIFKQTEDRVVLDEPAKTVVTIATAVPCRVLSTPEGLQGTRLEGKLNPEKVRVILPHDTDVDPGDNAGWAFYITVGTATYEIVRIEDSLTNSVFVSVTAERVR